MSPLPSFDKYYYYTESVQSPEEDVQFFQKVYRDYGGEPQANLMMREDFCSTFRLCCEWVKLDERYKATGVDLDPETIAYGEANYKSALNPGQQDRIRLLQENVLTGDLPKADIVCATNFSYFIFKKREELLTYFKNCAATMNPGGVLILDCFGGSQCYEANEEETEHEDGGFSYFWDQDSFDPITNGAQFYIHFQREGEEKREKVFSYNWRMWSIPEIREILAEAGLTNFNAYWEGTDEDGEGDGEFTRTDVGEECESWIAYLTASK